MATSFTQFKGYGFWAADHFVEGLAFLLAWEYGRIGVSSPKQAAAVAHWNLQATVGFAGHVSLDLDTHCGGTPADHACLSTALHHIAVSIDVQNQHLTLTEMRAGTCFIPADFESPIDYARVVELAIALVDGQLKTNAASPIDYW
ncbi:MAG: hypothetical protein AAF386_05210 [Pseudomonadota bacterium]